MVMTPVVDTPSLLFGSPNCGVLNRLNACAVNCRVNLSLNERGALQPYIVIDLARSAQYVATGIAVGVGSGRHEGRRVEPAAGPLIGRIECRAGNYVRPRRGSGVSRIEVQNWREGQSGLERGHTGNLPAAQNGARNSRLCEQRFATSKRQFVDVAHR